MKTLVNIDNDILKDYKKFSEINQNWNIGCYINTFYDLNTAVAISKLYFPDFIDKLNCVILDMRYEDDIFNQWYKELNGDISQIEKMCNLYELKDFFHINDSIEDKREKGIMLDALGKIIKKSWEISLEKLYPKKSFKVEIFEDFGSKFITFYSI